MTTLHRLQARPPGRELDRGAQRITLSIYLDQWLATKASLRPATLVSYRIHINKFLKPSLGHLRLTRLTVVDVEHAQSMIGSGMFGAVSCTTQHRIHATLMSALNTAVRRGLVPTNPAALVELPTVQRPEMSIWTNAQAQAFLRGSRAHRWQLVYRLLLICGLRRGEALAIQWRDLDLDARTLHIRRQLTLVAGNRSVGSPKSAKGVRTVHLDEETANYLRIYGKQATCTSAAGFVFHTGDGTALDPAAVSRQFTALVKELGLPVIRLHDLRHTSASLGLEAGEPITQVSRRLGHSTIAITGDIYTHISSTAAQQAVDTLAARMGSHLRSPMPL